MSYRNFGYTDSNNNVIAGNACAPSIGAADNNVCIGQGAASVLSTGDDNVVMGQGAAPALSSGSNNVAIGQGAAPALSSGYSNVSIGTDVSPTMQTGYQNVHVGHLAKGHHILTNKGVSIGYNSQCSGRSVTVGSEAGQGNEAGDNCFVGYQAGQSSTVGFMIAIGEGAAQNKSSEANGMIAIGIDCMKDVADITNNVIAIGPRIGTRLDGTMNNSILIGADVGTSTNTFQNWSGPDNILIGNGIEWELNGDGRLISSTLAVIPDDDDGLLPRGDGCTYFGGNGPTNNTFTSEHSNIHYFRGIAAANQPGGSNFTSYVGFNIPSDGASTNTGDDFFYNVMPASESLITLCSQEYSEKHIMLDNRFQIATSSNSVIVSAEDRTSIMFSNAAPKDGQVRTIQVSDGGAVANSDGTFPVTAWTSSASGIDLDISVVVLSGTVTEIQIHNRGSAFSVGETVTIDGIAGIATTPTQPILLVQTVRDAATAPKGSLWLDSGNAALWQNTDGVDGWQEVAASGGGGLNPPSVSEDGYVAIASSENLSYLRGSANGDVLGWNESSESWESQTPSGGGGGSESEITAVPGVTEDDFAPTGWSTATVVRLNPAAASSITGFDGSASVIRKTLFNVSSFNVTLEVEDTDSLAANRMALPGIITILPNGGVELVYDSTSSRWRVK